MSASRPPDDQKPQTVRTFATRAQMADYLEAQAAELERTGSFDPPLQDIALSFADLARSHRLPAVAMRFEQLVKSKATGTNGD
jgi:hypothetical protein